MKTVFDKFCQEINFEKSKYFNDVSITKAKLIDKDAFELIFNNPTIIPFSEMLQFIKNINQNFRYKTKLQFIIMAPIYDEEIIKPYLSWIINEYLQKKELASIISNTFKSVDDEGKISLILNNEQERDAIAKEHQNIIRIMKRFGFENLSLKYSIYVDEKILDNERLVVIDNIRKESAIQKKKSHKSSTLIAELHNQEWGQTNITVSGKIFSKDVIKTRNGMQIFIFHISDVTEAIVAKAFVRNNNDVNHYNSFVIGQDVLIQGKLQLDNYSQEQNIMIDKLTKIDNEEEIVVDEAKIKRVELNFRSRMSTMDGIKTASELVHQAKQLNHNAVAIMDDNSVQSFPEFYRVSKENGIKAIYGASIKTISNKSNAVYNPADRDLLSDEYVVFDLETTGLSPEYCDLIEFGATIIKNKRIISSEQFFIKPTSDIPRKITEITNITNENVKDAISQKEGIKKIIDYIGDRTIVAHNANFDYTFLKTSAKRHLNINFNNPTIDTLITSRISRPDMKRFRLEYVAKKYYVNYDNSVSHRADYDADVLAKIWTKQIDDLLELNIKNQHDLVNYKNDTLLEKQFSRDVSIIAKNQKGLKELFKIISRTLTNNFKGDGRYLKNELSEYKNILIGSSALKGKLVDLIFTGSKEQIINEISFYDYIEIQPLQNFAHLVGEDLSLDDLKDMIKFIIKESKKQNKIIVATGDARYFKLDEKIYHEIYIHSKGLGGVRHYLFNYSNYKNPTYPDQNLLTTNEMLESFSFLDKDLANEIVVENSNKIADMVEQIEVIKDKLYTPEMDNVDEKLENLVYRNARDKYGDTLPKIVESRIKREIEPIKKYGFSVIYWISHMLVDKSLNDGYLVGSRGSVGSSIVATLSNITEVNPLDPHYLCKECKWSEFFPNSKLNSGYDLEDKDCPNCHIPLLKEGQKIPFETFLGFEADKVPDIDLNFSGDYQPVIHNEVKSIFGKSHSFRAGTISTVAEKTAFGYVKAWMEETDHKGSKAFIEYLAKNVAGTKRTTGQHPGGIIVIPHKMDVEDFSPVNYPANDENSSWKTTHFDFHAIHDNVLKLDLLGHDDPTAIKYLEKLTGVNVKTDVKFSDPKIISLFSSPEELGIKPKNINGEKTGIMGIPEFGTQFVRRMLKTANVKSFGDLISVSGLSHGTDVWAGNAEILIKDNKTLSEVISCRDDIMTDLMEKGIDSSTAFEIMERVRKGHGLLPIHEKTLKENKIENWYIDSLQKIKYMFPKAHATAYVMMAWRIAWFKLYKPEAFYATYFTTRADVFDIATINKGGEKIQEVLKDFIKRRNSRSEDKLTNKEIALIPILEIANEALARNIKISNINLQKSKANNWFIDSTTNELIPPFVALDGLGEAVAKSIVEAREEKAFSSIEDLKKRSSINQTTIKHLRELNVLDDLSEKNQISMMDFLV